MITITYEDQQAGEVRARQGEGAYSVWAAAAESALCKPDLCKYAGWRLTSTDLQRGEMCPKQRAAVRTMLVCLEK